MRTIEYLISPLQTKEVYAYCDYAGYTFYSYYRPLAHWKETVTFGIPRQFLPKILSS